MECYLKYTASTDGRPKSRSINHAGQIIFAEFVALKREQVIVCHAETVTTSSGICFYNKSRAESEKNQRENGILVCHDTRKPIGYCPALQNALTNEGGEKDLKKA